MIEKIAKYGWGPVWWTILANDEQVTMCPMEEQAKANMTGEETESESNTDGTTKAPAAAGGGIFKRSPFKVDIVWHPSTLKVDYNGIFLEHMFPDLKDKARLFDRYLWDVQCPYYQTVVNYNIKFHRAYDKDPNRLLSRHVCVTYILVFPCSQLCTVSCKHR